MQPIAAYNKITVNELRDELVELTSALAAEYENLGVTLADHHRDYLRDYAQSPGNSVAAKNREAEWNNMELATEIFHTRATINGLILRRDLCLYLLVAKTVGAVPFPDIALMDVHGLAVV